MEGIAVVRTVPTREEAELLRGVLEANGIEAFVVSDDARGLQPPLELVSGVKLLVAEDEKERALEVLQGMEEGQDVEDG
jgi:hypothetical protein